MLHFYLRTLSSRTPSPSSTQKRRADCSDSIRSIGMGAVRTLQRIFMRPHDMSWARHSHLPVREIRERSPDIPLDGVMQDVAFGLRRITLPRTPVNKGEKRMSRGFYNPAFVGG